MTDPEPSEGAIRCDLVIPALNERPNIDRLFDELEAVSGDIRHIVLADNGSTDGTPDAATARGAIVVHQPERGYGAACLAGLAWLAEQPEPPAVVVFLDADLADDPAQLPRLLVPIRTGRVPIVIGSRVRHGEDGALNFVQRFGNGLACLLMRLLGGRRYHDLGPFRAVEWPTLQRLRMADRTWGWTVELQMKAAMLNIPCEEIDVPYRRRPAGKSKISGTVRGVVTAGTKIIWTIFALRLRKRRLIRADRRDRSGQ